MAHYKDLRAFIALLKEKNLLKTVDTCVDPNLEITEICDRVLKQSGPALLFNHPKDSNIPLLGNLFGTTQRIALAMGKDDVSELHELGEVLAYLRQPDAPRGLKDAIKKIPLLKKVLSMSPKIVKKPPAQEVIYEGDQVDLSQLPIQTCWPKDAAPLITWGLVITQGPHKERQNLGIYRQQVLNKNQVIMRWLAHRGGALDFAAWQKAHPNERFPMAVALGADPATTLAAVTPIPDSLSEYQFAGLLRGHKTALSKALHSNLMIPSYAEIILEGYLDGTTAPEGPFGDHTGYYNEVESFPVFTITAITHRKNPIYHSTYTGKPPDEPAVLGEAMNQLLVPLLKKQFPEIVDFYLPPAGCSYRFAVVSIKKKYPGHPKRIMLGIWSYLTQFMYTKFIVVVDEDINIQSQDDVLWAITTRVDPKRDVMMLENTPIDYLDFASVESGLGSKMAIDATNKWPQETKRIWGDIIEHANVDEAKIQQILQSLNT